MRDKPHNMNTIFKLVKDTTSILVGGIILALITFVYLHTLEYFNI